jgi:predicted nucleotidyltransferase
VKSGVPQPNISDYENGRRIPNAATLERLDSVLRTPSLARVRAARASIIRFAQQRRLSNVRIFGSVAWDAADAVSDVDLLVHPAPDASSFDLAGFMADVEELLGTGVDVVSDRGTGPTMERIKAEAVAL